MSDTRRTVVRSGRGVGYCVNRSCDHYGRGRVLAARVDPFVCSRCRQVGKAEFERGSRQGSFELVSEVRVEYAFDPMRDIYTLRAVVSEERLLRPHAIYTLQTPLIQTPEMACALGRAILNRLNEKTFAKKHPTWQPSRDQLRAEGWQTLV